GEGAVSQTIQADPLHVHVGDGQVTLKRKALAAGQAVAQFVNGGLAVPSQVSGAFAPTRGGEDIGGQGSGRLAGAQDGPVASLADQDVGGRQVEQDARARQRLTGRGRQRGPVVLADLDGEDEAGPV